MLTSQRKGLFVFLVTCAVALLVYSMTLAPNVTLGYSGVFATAAMHPGPSTPSGHPVWALVGWAWIRVFPFGNVAWRLAVGSAVAAAISSGLIATIVWRIGRSISSDERVSVVAGISGGLGFAFEKGFWSKAVVVDSWTLTMLMFVLVLYCVSCWFFETSRGRWLYVAPFVAGVGLSESHALAPAIYVMPLVVGLADVKLGRDLFFVEAAMLWSWAAGKDWLLDVGWNVVAVWGSVVALASGATVGWLVCWLIGWRSSSSRQAGAWRSHGRCLIFLALFVAGLLFLFCSPVLSMTNPPMSWGYPRTKEGFAHVLSRGQFDSFRIVGSVSELAKRMGEYGVDLLRDVGPIYLLAALGTLAFWRRSPREVRRWIVGTWVMWIVVTVISVAALNIEEPEIANARALFGPGNAVLMILAGCGMVMAFAPKTSPVHIAPVGDANDQY